MTTHDEAAQVAIMSAPMPTPTTLKRRKNLFYQLIRFIAINLKMLKVISASHH